jgi:anti-sigma regulatory factor (Ser/Thr protein kinase)
MKKVAYHFLNAKHEKLLKEFCESEDLTAFPLKPNDTCDLSLLLYVTDDVETITRNFGTAVKRCLISNSERTSTEYFVLNDHLNKNSFRVLLDEIYHGDKAWNIVDGLSFELSVKECTISNNIANVERFVCLVTEDLCHFCNFSTLEKIRMGFSEMLTNAIEHGNLNITSSEKHEATENGTFQELVQERSKDKRYSDKRVRCRVGIFSDRINIIISDQGMGFDVNALPNPDDPELLFKLHGRGVYIAKAYFDEVKYNDKGNEVYLVKRF